MRLAALILLTGCGVATQNPYFCMTKCGLGIAATNRVPQFPCEDYRKIEDALADMLPGLPVCRALYGSSAWEMPGFSTMVLDEVRREPLLLPHRQRVPVQG